MKIYKVYAQCCKAVKGITEITLFDAENLISETVCDMVDMGDIEVEGEDDGEINMYYDFLVDMAIKYFKTNDHFFCGDFAIIRSNEYPTRSGSYGWTRDFY